MPERFAPNTNPPGPNPVAHRPEITAEMRQTALAMPGQWMYAIDPEFDPDGAVPPWGIKGCFAVGPDGRIDESGWMANPNYLPGPQTLGFPMPRTRLDRVLQLVSARHRPPEELLHALADAEVVVPESPAFPGIPIVESSYGPTLYMFADHHHLHPNTPRIQVPVMTLLPMLAGVTVRLNPGMMPAATLRGNHLANALRELRGFIHQPPPPQPPRPGPHRPQQSAWNR
jgi:hypothetical protein